MNLKDINILIRNAVCGAQNDGLKPFVQFPTKENPRGSTKIVSVRPITLQSYSKDSVLCNWVSGITSVEAKSFGKAIKKLKDKIFWDQVARNGGGFMIFMDERLIGIVQNQACNSLDVSGIPCDYGYKKRKGVVTRNVADLVWLKCCGGDKALEESSKGVMQHALKYIINKIMSVGNNVSCDS